MRHGPEAVWPYYFAGTMGLVRRDGINRLRHVMGYSRQHSTICSTACESGWIAGVGRYGGPDPREMAQADLIVMWGGNPVSTQVNVMTHVTRARKQRGARFVVVDPYRTLSAASADIHLAPRPGTDGALACAVMHVLFRDGTADRGYMAEYADCPDRLEAHLRDRGPAWAAGITGLTAAEIEDFAALYGHTDRAFLRLGYGFSRSRSRNGSASLHAVTCLPTVGGKWRHPGGGAFWNHRGNGIYHWDKTLIEGLDALDPGTRRMDMSRIGAVLDGDPAELGDGPPVAALLIQNTNPVVVAPDSNRVRRGFLRDDLFVCVHEQFMTETAALADVVLPATMFLEHDDLYAAGGHTHLQVGPKLIDPPGECRSNHQVLQGLARRLGARHPGFEMTAMQMVDATLRVSGWPGAEEMVARRWIDADEGFERSHFLTGFGFPDGRFRFAPDWAAVGPHHAGVPALPDHWAATDEATPGHPDAGQPQARGPAHGPGPPGRGGPPGHRGGGRVTLGNGRGTVTVHARLAASSQPGVVVVESVWPNADFTGGVGINALTRDAPAAPNGGAVFHDTAVWMRAEPALAVAAE